MHPVHSACCCWLAWPAQCVTQMSSRYLFSLQSLPLPEHFKLVAPAPYHMMRREPTNNTHTHTGDYSSLCGTVDVVNLDLPSSLQILAPRGNQAPLSSLSFLNFATSTVASLLKLTVSEESAKTLGLVAATLAVCQSLPFNKNAPDTKRYAIVGELTGRDIEPVGISMQIMQVPNHNLPLCRRYFAGRQRRWHWELVRGGTTLQSWTRVLVCCQRWVAFSLQGSMIVTRNDNALQPVAVVN